MMAIKLVLFLLLISGGAIVNVAVAWGCALHEDRPVRLFEIDTGNNYGSFIRLDHSGSACVDILPGKFRIQHSRGISGMFISVMQPERFERELPSWSRFRTPSNIEALYDDYHPVNGFATYVEHACGWPLISLRSMFIKSWGTPAGTVDIPTEFLGSPLRLRRGASASLPLRPIWPGFAINTIFYAAILWGVLWVLLVIPGSVKRLRRRRRGQCPACGYPVGSSPRCTECGGKLNVRSSSSLTAQPRQCMGLPPPATPAPGPGPGDQA